MTDMNCRLRHILFAIVAFITTTSLHAQDFSSYHKGNIECLEAELDGSLTLRVTGAGKNRSDAEEQAKKNAVYEIIFKGIVGSASGKITKPLVTEVNARERYEDYFDQFFADGGAYKKYVSKADAKRSSKEKTKKKYENTCRLTVRVLRSELKLRLKEDGIIKK